MTSTDYSKLSRPQKIAALLIVAGPDAAADILRTFPDREVEEICRLMGEFEVVSVELKDFLIVEFEPLIIGGLKSIEGGFDFAKNKFNHVTQAWRQPGSSFKPFVAYAALDSGQLVGGSEYEYPDRGSYQLTSIDKETCLVVKCIYRNALCGGGNYACRYGDVTVEDALAVSSDTFFYKIGEEIFAQRGGQPILQDEVRKFGFGSRCGDTF